MSGLEITTKRNALKFEQMAERKSPMITNLFLGSLRAIKNKDFGLPGIPMIHSAIDLIWANDVPALYIHVTTS